MQERDFYSEKQETRPLKLTCPFCRQAAEYSVRWLVRTKRREPPRGARPEDVARFSKARSYMIRLDEQVACSNIRCRKRFEIPTQQSVVLL